MGQIIVWQSSLTRLTGTNTLSVVALAEQTVDTADRECETSLGRAPVKCVSHCHWSMLDPARREITYDCAFFEPEAFPPDLPPPAILMDLGEKSGFG